MIKIREAMDTDLPGILEIYNEIILHTTAVYDYEPHTLEMRKQWFLSKKEGNFPVFVAAENDSILGFSSLGSFRNWAAYRYTAENSVYVKESERGKGLGKLLMEPVVKAAEKLGMHVLVAGIDSENIPSLRLHHYFGFREVAHFREVGWKFGRWLDLKFFQLIVISATRPE